MNENKCIIVGITGGIAVYKICYLVSSLKKQGYDVHVLMSKEAQEFVTPLTFQTLSNNKVITDMFTIDYTPDVHHISLAKKADLFVIAPATANVIAKVANGIADDMLTTTFLASNCEKLIVPAMNTQMLMNPVTQDNIQKCKNYGMHIFESDSGYLACGDVGKGRLPEPDEIEDKIKEVMEDDKFLAGKHILVTAGPTSEAIDPVRMITNHSTGKMGYALARAARNMGAHVTLVSGTKQIEDIRDVEMVHVTSAKDMAEAVLSRQNDMDCMILAAAVADYTPVSVADNKIHKSEGEMSIPLKRTQDILKTLGENKKDGQVLIGFSMETENMVERTKEKLVKKNCDYIVANNLKEKGAGFGTDTNIVTLISKDYEKEFGILSKYDTAVKILKTCLKEKKA
ncbi:MAG: bifunctional phosphopantothenoylcysteine decarboxylase/phosphopantothenate--cysteine ligase CoaBC [Erysipelotrichaceae bacterium]|nr:bifunctional phosphopantothenoylcysteine decarboxylase/phosphopantothenate--cysteine ligase CoaBC [Erysipelotrichaceae bacterium]